MEELDNLIHMRPITGVTWSVEITELFLEQAQKEHQLGRLKEAKKLLQYAKNSLLDTKKEIDEKLKQAKVEGEAMRINQLQFFLRETERLENKINNAIPKSGLYALCRVM